MRAKGNKAEALAIDYVVSHGCEIIATNYYSRYGEIDIIFMDKLQVCVFAEVKYRKSGINQALYSISAKKQQKLLLTAQEYIASIGRDIDCRFDAILLDDDNIVWLKNIID